MIMKKTLISVSLVLAMAILSFFASATASISLSKSALALSKSLTSGIITVTNNGNEALDISLDKSLITIEEGSKKISISISPVSFSLDAGNSNDISIAATGDTADISAGEYTNTFTINGAAASGNTTSQTPSIIFQSDFCKKGALNDTDLSMDVSIDNLGEGETTNWLPLDRIQIEVEVENNANFDMNNVFFQLGLFEKDSKKNIADDLIWISKDEEKVEVSDIDSDDKAKHTFEFKVSSDAGIDENDYILMIKAYPEGKEDEFCIDSTSDFGKSFFEEIGIDREDADERWVIFDDIIFEPATALCREQVTLKAKIFNIGEDDLDEVKTKLFSSELGVDLYEITSSLDAGEEANIEFTFTIPANTAEKTHKLELRNFYDFDEDFKPEEDRAYDKYTDAFPVELIVKGKCASQVVKSIELSADAETAIQSGGQAGEDVVIKITAKNTGSEATTYSFSANGYESWAVLKSIFPLSLSLAPEESRDLLVTLNIDSKASGVQAFNVKASFGSQSEEKPIQIPIEAKTSFLTGFAITENLRQNWFIWVIVAINVILILAIIIVAVKISRA